MFPVKLEPTKSPLKNYELQSAAGKRSILQKIVEVYPNDFETKEKVALDNEIKLVERALKQL